LKTKLLIILRLAGKETHVADRGEGPWWEAQYSRVGNDSRHNIIPKLELNPDNPEEEVRNVYFTLFPGDPEKQIEYLNHHGQARYRDWQCVTMGEYVRFQGMVIHASQFSDCGLEMFQEGHPSKFGELMTFQKFCRIRSVYHLARVPSDTPYDLSLDPWLPERILEEQTNKNRIENVGPPMTICMDETGIPCQPRARKDTGDGLHITQMVGKPAEFSIQEKISLVGTEF